MIPKFKKPKNGQYNFYCFSCKHWNYKRTVGCANLGVCKFIEDEPTEQDAYDGACGGYEKKK